MSEETLFHEALARPADERAAFLDAACAGQPQLRAAVEALLAAHEASGHPLDRPAPEPEPSPETVGYVPAGEQVGTVIAGRYKLLEQIGEGGMGTVWVAEQTQPVRRKVALKLIKAGMDSKSVLSRFEAERQALALMDHPNIAKVLDGGTTDAGRPFFVMEYVKGVPFTTYCDDAQLSIAERLALFVPVCQAVQHAHQKGIIHRDLKPSNILICLYDGQPVPKVIDFGLAKAIHQPLTEHTLYTAHGVLMGTPLYMSPEQAEVNNLDVDTRTDIYSLGVILYELLTGTTPLERKRFKQAAWQEMLRLIKEEEPPRPSARLSGSGSLPSVAVQRKSEPVKLTRLVRGELDWIVMKCLEKDRSRRYETANGVARELQRYLADEVVEARPPSAGYRLRKFARHHRTALSTAVAFAGLLVLAAAICAWQAIRATRAEAQALTDRDEAVAQRQRAKRNYELARQAVENYLSKVTYNERLKETDLHAMRKELLESALPYYEKFAQQEGDDAEGEAERGRTYYRLAQVRFLLGEEEKALADFKQLETIFAPLEASHSEVPEYKRYLALSRYGMARSLTRAGKHTEGDKLYRAALELQEQLVDKYPTVPDYRKELADTHTDLGIKNQPGQPRLGLDWEKELRCALSHYEKLVTDFPRVTEYIIGRASVQERLGNALMVNGRYHEGEEIARHNVADLQSLPAQTRGIARLRLTEARAHGLLAWVYVRQRRNDEAVKEGQADIDIKGALAAEFPSVPEYRQSFAYAHRNLGHWYRYMRLWEQSKQEFHLARTLLVRFAADHPAVAEPEDVGFRDHELAQVFLEQGLSTQALELCTRAEQYFREIRRQKPEHASLPLADECIGVCRARALAQQGHYADALAEAERWGAKPSNGENAYDVACAYSLLSAAALQHDKLAPPERARISEAHASRASKLLAGMDWKRYGCVFGPWLEKDQDFVPLRTRPDFIDLVKRVEEGWAKQAGK